LRFSTDDQRVLWKPDPNAALSYYHLMASKPTLASTVAPVTIRAAGCATAFFLGGPLAAAMAAYGGDVLVELLRLSDGAIAGSLKEFPKGIAGNIANFVAGAAYEKVRDANGGSLRRVFGDALAATLQAVRSDFLKDLAEPDQEYYAGWFDRWASRLRKDDLPEFTDASLLDRFVRQGAKTVEEGLRPVLIEILMRLDAEGFLQLDRRPIDPTLEAALIERLPVHLPLQLSLALAGQDKLWKVVQDQKINAIIAKLGELGRPPVSIPQPRLLQADSPILQPRQGLFVGRAELAGRIARELAASAGDLVYVYGAPGMGKTALCAAALRHYLEGHPESTALFVDLRAAEDLPTLLGACADALGDLSLKDESEIRHRLAQVAQAQQGPLILYFDNFESVAGVNGTVRFVRTLTGLDGIRVLCSTRQDLGAVVGRGMPLSPLDGDSARTLFLACWHRNARAPQLNSTPVLDGFLRVQLSYHPLSIVLTAGRGAAYRSLDRLIEEWKRQGLRIADSSDGNPERSLRASLSLSWRLLSPKQRQFLLVLSLFPEGLKEIAWTDLADFVPEAWEHRAHLSEASLVEPMPDGTGLALLAPVREFVIGEATQVVPSGTSQPDATDIPDPNVPDLSLAVGTALTYYRRFASEGGAVSGTPAVVAARLRLAGEFLNLVGLLNRIGPREAANHSGALESLAVDLCNIYQFSALAGLTVARELHRLMQATGSQLGRANTLLNLGQLAFLLGRNEEARSHWDRALPLYDATGDQLGQANTLRNLGQLDWTLLDFDAASARLHRALDLYTAIQEPVGLASSLALLSLLARSQGDPQNAALYLQQAAEWSDRSGVPALIDQIKRLREDP